MKRKYDTLLYICLVAQRLMSIICRVFDPQLLFPTCAYDLTTNPAINRYWHPPIVATYMWDLREFVTKISRRFAIDSMRSVILFSALTLMLHTRTSRSRSIDPTHSQFNSPIILTIAQYRRLGQSNAVLLRAPGLISRYSTMGLRHRNTVAFTPPNFQSSRIERQLSRIVCVCCWF